MGFLQVGPQYYPPRPHGAQIIRRGPHGMRFAADPMPMKGGGFRWWEEQMVAAGDDQVRWKPQQQVVGVMGLGGVLSTAWNYWTSPSAPGPVAPGQSVPVGSGNAALDAARSALRTVGEQAALCNFTAADRALAYARSQINMINDPSLRGAAEGEWARGASQIAASRSAPGKCRQGRANFDARVAAAQESARIESDRARMAEEGGASLAFGDAFGLNLSSGLKKAAVVAGVVLVAAPFVVPLMYGFGSGLGMRGLGPRPRRSSED